MLGDWMLWLWTVGCCRPNEREVERNWPERHLPNLLFSLLHVHLCTPGENPPSPRYALALCSPVCPLRSRSVKEITLAFWLKGGGWVCAMSKGEGWEAPCILRSPAGSCASYSAPEWMEFSRSIPLCYHHFFVNSKKHNSWKCILSTQLTWSTSGFQRECCERFEIATLWKKLLGLIIDT